ncbi:hypothetical protein ACQ4PT_040211 [Festuca glaucescens]
MGYVGSHGVATLRRYKYSGVDHSIVAKYILQPFWSRFVHLFPLWFPPAKALRILFFPDYADWFHVSTDIGLPWLCKYLSSIICIHLILIQHPLDGFILRMESFFSFTRYPPLYAQLTMQYFIMMFSLSSINKYETFDAVDGKQARRTNSSSPLGELFDHGCDALACAFESLAFGSTAMCGKATFWFWVISAVPFYFATWEHYFTNTLVLPIVNGPTEGLMLIYVCHIFTFFTGAEWWAQDFRKSVPLLNWVPLVPEIPLYVIVLFLMIAFAVIPTVGSNTQNVYKVVAARKGSMLLALAMLFPFGLLMAGSLVWSYVSPSDIMRTQPHLLIIGTGFAFGFLVGRMILAHLCDEPKGLKTGMCMSLAYFPFAIVNALTARLDDGNPLVDEQLVLLMYCLYTDISCIGHFIWHCTCILLHLLFMRSPTHLGFIASESPGKRHSSDQCTWSLPNKQNTPTYLRYTDDDVRFIFASVITGTLSPSVLTGTLSLKCTSALRICADEKTMYMNQLAKFCCILCRADARRKLFGETLS